ncbi:MAG: hypothetical protein ABIH19_04085, partial [Candidatus Omnitrophota bacterium]
VALGLSPEEAWKKQKDLNLEGPEKSLQLYTVFMITKDIQPASEVVEQMISTTGLSEGVRKDTLLKLRQMADDQAVTNGLRKTVQEEIKRISGSSPVESLAGEDLALQEENMIYFGDMVINDDEGIVADEVASASSAIDRTRALIISPELFKSGGIINVLESLSEFSNLTIGLYGRNTKIKDIFLNNSTNIITADNFGNLLTLLDKNKVLPTDIIVISSSEDLLPLMNTDYLSKRQIKHIISEPQTPAVLLAAKAIKELYSDLPEITAALEDLYNQMAQEGILPENDTDRDMLLASVTETVATLSIKPTPEVNSRITEEVAAIMKFTDQI